MLVEHIKASPPTVKLERQRICGRSAKCAAVSAVEVDGALPPPLQGLRIRTEYIPRAFCRAKIVTPR